LVIPASLRFEEWAEAGPKISRVIDSFAWCLGDWLVYGQNKYDNRYTTVLEQVGLDYKTLRNYAWVARKIPMNRRRERLSFQHHAEVASLPAEEQDRWLGLAEEYSWTRSHLRKEIAAARAAGSPRRLPPAPAWLALPRIQVETDRVRDWRVAADRVSMDFEEWIVATLDAAARTAKQHPAGDPGDPTDGPDDAMDAG
jgi:hypothetical protein